MKSLLILLLSVAYSDKDKVFPTPDIPFSPRHYTCVFVEKPPVIDGKLDDAVWQDTRFSALFVDIEGTAKPAPLYDTRMAMVFDNDYLYIAARLDEPHVWATLTERDSIIFYDNDFEVFIDPDGDTHEYYELEVNAFGTAWDLFLTKPYRDSGTALHDWNITGLKVATNVDGTINDPSDMDQGWQVEIAIPFKALSPAAHKTIPPSHGDRWRMNFSRVEWRVDAVDGTYRKKVDPATDKPYPEYNWVWSPQGLIQMHYPEMWGFVTFARAPLLEDTKWLDEAFAKWSLRQVYYQQRLFHQAQGRYAAKLDELGTKLYGPKGYLWPPLLYTTPNSFEVVLTPEEGKHRWHLASDGRIWRETP